MNQNYQFLARGSSAPVKMCRSAIAPPLEQKGFRERTWRSCLNPMNYCTALLMLFFLLFSSWNAFSQVSINETFDGTSTPTGWTYTSFARSTTNTCAGAGSLRKNQWSSSTTANATTPTWTSNGQNVSIQFSYKLLNYHGTNPTVATSNSPAWGSIITELSTNGGTSYGITVGTIDATNHVVSTSCATRSYVIPGSSVPSASSLKVRFRLTFAGSTPDYFVYLDDVVITQVSLNPPSCIASPTAPANNATAVTSPVFTWPAASGAPTGYKFYLGTDAQATNVFNGTDLATATSYTYTGALTPATVYYWKVVPYNANGDAISCTTWSFTTGATPACLSTSAPASGSTTSYSSQKITWSAVSGATSYDVYFGTTNPPAFAANQTALSYAPVLAANTTYYWRVVPKNITGGSTECSVNTLLTASAIYCVPTTSSGCTDGDVIARVQLNTLDNNSGTGCPSGLLGFSDYTSNSALTTTLQAGASYQCKVWAGQYSEGYAAWIDYNDDGTFASNERIGYSNGQVTGSGTVGVLGSSATFTISLACNPPVGVHRMRVRAMFNTNGIDVTPCTNNTYGETEDYLVTITEPAACPQPSNLAVGTITATTANLSWVLGCAETAWEVLVQPASSAAPTAGTTGVAATSASYVAEGLSAGIPYNFYVRANCGPQDGVSLWSGPISFNTPPNQAPECATPLLPANGATEVTLGANASVNISWSPSATGQVATSYDVYFGQSATTLTNLGNTTGTNVNITGLVAGQTNYWKIVPKNSVGSADIDNCTVFSFTTAVSAGDNCAMAIDLGAQTSPYTGNTTNFTSHVTLSCGSSTTSPDGYYKITVPSNYTLNIAVNSSWDAVHSIFYGSCASQTAIVACSDTDVETHSWSNFTGSSQTVYWIQDGWGTSSNSGAFTLTWSLTPPPDCVPPTALVTNVSGTSANISWTASDSNPANGYQYEVRSTGAVLSGNTGLITSGTTTGSSIPTVNNLTIGTTYTVYVRSLCSETISSSWNSKAFLVPVPNDVCANAVTIACGSVVNGTTINATNENMAVCGISGVTTQSTAGVWYKFTGDGSDVTLTTCGGTGSPDTRIAVYTGLCGEMTCIGGNDDNSACTANTVSSEVLFSTIDGVEYYILMYNWNTTAAFRLSMSCVTPCTPATTNDNCSTAVALTLGTPLASNNTCSTPTSGVAYPSCGNSFATYYDTWYTFNSGTNTSLEVSLTGASASTGFILYTGTCGNTFTPVSNSCAVAGAATTITVAANTNYHVRVYTSGAAGRGNFTVSVKVPCLRPTGVSASAVTVNTATVSWTPSTSSPSNGYEYEVRFAGAAGSGESGLVATGTTSSASVNLTDLFEDTQHTFYIRSVCGAGDYSPWTTGTNFTTLTGCYRPTSPGVANVTATTATLSWTPPTEALPQSGYGWEIRTAGAAGTGATGLAASGNTTGTTVNTNALSPSTAYTLYVRSRCGGSSYSGWTTGVTFSTTPANDACSGAIAITCGGPSLTGTTVGATNENMAVCGIAGVTAQNTPGVWYKYVSNGTDVTFSTCNAASGDTRIAVYKGTCAALTCVGGNDDNNSCTASTLSSEVTIADTQAGATYYILVYAYSFSSPATTTVNFVLTATCAPACTPAAGNNESETAQTIFFGSTPSNNTCATASLGYNNPSCASAFATYYDVWYKFNTGSTTFIDMSLTSSSPVAVGYALYSGTPGALTQVDSSCEAAGALTSVTGLTANTTYYIRVYSISKTARGNFTINLSVPCKVPTGLVATNTQNSATFYWTASASAPMNGYQYEIRTSGTAGSGAAGLAASGTTTSLSKEVTGLAADTNYTVYVRSACGSSDFSPWTSGVAFRTGYCIPAPTSGIGDGITKVSYDTVNNVTGAESGNYGNYAAMSGLVQRANTANFKVKTAMAANAKVWVDWNNDFDFNDTGEEVYSGATVGDSLTATFTVPVSTSVGNHRMRIGAGTSSSLTPCYTGAAAAFEDYTLNVDTMGPVNLNNAACNSTVTSFTQGLYSTSAIGAQGYRFRVKNGAAEQIIERTTPFITLSMLTSPAFGVTYLIDVAVKLNGEWTDYGKVCKVTTVNPVQASKLELCNTGGTSVAAFTTPIYAVYVPSATNYRFQITSSQGTVTFDRPSRYFSLNMLSSYDYNIDYSVRVATLSGGVWSAYGDACIVRVDMPTATLRPQYCGGTVPLKGTAIYATNYPGAVSFRFRVTYNGTAYEINRTVGYFMLNQVPTFIPPGATVAVEVKVFTASAQSAYGPVCNVTLANPNGRPGADNESDTDTAKQPEAKLSGFPNPFRETFALNFTTESEEMVNIVVYDMTGKLVDKRTVSANELPTLQIGDNFAAGVYNLILTQGETIKTLRVVKNVN
jgi:hypothetical protein